MTRTVLIENCSLFEPEGARNVRSILIRDGLIESLSESETQPLASGSIRLDAKGGTVIPGLIDTHCHPFDLGSVRRILDLRGTTNITSLRLRLSARAQRTKEGVWIVGAGWDQEALSERRLPDRSDVDDLTPNNPVLLTRICGHMGLLNSRAMRELMIDESTAAPEGGMHDKGNTGRLTGLVKEAALKEAQMKIPTPDQFTIREDILTADYEAAKNGITTLHTILSQNYSEELEALASLHKEGKLLIRHRIFVPIEALKHIEEKRYREIFDKDVIRINGVKIFSDGSLGARTASLTEPYSDDPPNLGLLRYSDSRLRGLIQEADKAGYQVAVHAIGDRAVLQCLEAFRDSLGSKNVNRHRLEHCSLCPPESIEKIRRIGLSVTIQPHFVISDNWAAERLGHKRLNWLYPFRSLLESGVIVSGSSDAPVEPLSPILGIWAAMVRSHYSPGQILTLSEAIQLYTVNVSYNGFDEKLLGRIAEDSVADLTILDSNIENMHPAMLRKVGVAATLVGGNVVFSYEGVTGF